MTLEGPGVSLYRFGLFEADLRNGRLLRSGHRVKIQDQPFRLLVILLRRAGQTVTREELRQELWPSDTFVEFDGSLNAAFKKVRYALGDSAENPRFIETVPKRGYRFIAPVEIVYPQTGAEIVAARRAGQQPEPSELFGESRGPAGSTGTLGLSLAPSLGPRPAEPVLVPFPVPKPIERRAGVSRLTLATLALAVAAAGAYALWPARPPRVLRRIQLTHFGRAEAGAGMATDGTRIFFSEVKGGHYSVDQVPVGGGDPTPFPLPFANSEVFDISPDHTELLVASFSGLGPDEALWVVPVTGGAPRRLGDALGSSGAWSPDGQTIAYTHGPDVYIVHADGNVTRRLVNMPGNDTGRVRWSPSGRALRFTITGGNASAPQWEVAADGSNLHPLPAYPELPAQSGGGYGAWTPDGRYFVFQSSAGGAGSVWAIRETAGILRRSRRKPVEVYAGPTLFYGPLPSTDGKRIFLIEEHGVGELMRYDSSSRQLVPHFGGIPARSIAFSTDGKRAAYILGADDELWLGKMDGSDAHRLTFPPMLAFRAEFSPDGRQIAFDAAGAGVLPGTYLEPVEGGGKPEPIFVPEKPGPGGLVGWSTDGRSLLLWEPNDAGTSFAIYALDLKSRKLARLPGSEGLHHGALSPDGLHVAALTLDDRSVMLYDLHTHQDTELAKGAAVVNPHWSRDSRSVFFQDIFQGSDQPIYRVYIDNRRMERVTGSAQALATDVTGYRLTGITPDDQVLALLIRSNSDLYALDVDFP